MALPSSVNFFIHHLMLLSFPLLGCSNYVNIVAPGDGGGEVSFLIA